MKIRDAKAFVTGGSGGLGAVIARTLAEYGLMLRLVTLAIERQQNWSRATSKTLGENR